MSTSIAPPVEFECYDLGDIFGSSSEVWSLPGHIRGHWGVEPDSPNDPCWVRWGLVWDETSVGLSGPSKKFRRDLQSMGPEHAPIAVTMYQWALSSPANGNWFVCENAIGGTVNSEPRVRELLTAFLGAQIALTGDFHSMGSYLEALIEWAPIPTELGQLIDRTLNNDEACVSVSDDALLRAWLAPFIGFLPNIDSWHAMKEAMDDSYPLTEMDLEISNIGHSGSEYQHYRMDLVLASWMSNEGSRKNLAVPLSRHLPRISMDNPDACTAVLWLAALQLIETKPHGREIPLLTRWMAEHGEYNTFVQTCRSVVESLLGNDLVQCGKEIHRLWHQRQILLDDVPLPGLLEPG